MLTKDFCFNLPEELIAQKPCTERGQSRLLFLDRASGIIKHSMVKNISEFLPSGAVMIFNDSKVRRARLYATTESGGKVEILLLRRIPLENGTGSNWAVMTNRMAKQRPGKILYLPEGVEVEILEAREDERIVHFSIEMNDEYLERNGHLPLPPYIKRDDMELDSDRYQTIYAKNTGSSAAPTAGLHFTPEILDSIKAKNVDIRFVTLHVGLGTFLPVREDKIEEHKMHTEEYSVPKETADAVNLAKKEGRPVIAVGTTSLRTLESAYKDGALQSGYGNTNIFIYPGYKFKVVDKLFTNFHTPESTLLMLVSAFAGKETIINAYEEAVKERYRFFSYGDAMFIS